MSDILKNFQKKVGAKPDGIFGFETMLAGTKYYKFSAERGAHFFGQLSIETGDFKCFEEILNYSVARLRKIFPKYFPNDDIANEFANNPEKLANYVFENIIGNGDASSGDGFKYRGRGAIQLTGKGIYTEFSKFIDKPEIIDNPDLVAVEYAFESAIFYFDSRKIWKICDEGVNDETIKVVTKIINGGFNGLEDRFAKTNLYYKYLTENNNFIETMKAFQKKVGAKPNGIFDDETLLAGTKYYKFSAEKGAHFFGQLSHETAEFKFFIENLNYSPARLRKIFPKYFPNDDIANDYAHNPEKLANYVYGNRIGNGDVSTGDGFKYRGRGAIQLTGKGIYTEFSKFIDKPEIIDNPDLVAAEFAFESAIFYFDSRKIWKICDEGVNDETIKIVTKMINYNSNGLEDRIAKTNSYYKYLSENL